MSATAMGVHLQRFAPQKHVTMRHLFQPVGQPLPLLSAPWPKPQPKGFSWVLYVSNAATDFSPGAENWFLMFAMVHLCSSMFSGGSFMAFLGACFRHCKRAELTIMTCADRRQTVM